MRNEEKPGFRRLPLFREMMTQTFDGLMQIAYSQNFPPRMDLIRQGEYADFLHIIVEGAVELRATWNGHKSVMGIVRPVSTFILAACVCDAAYLMSARTTERSRIVMIPAADLRSALRRDPDFAMAAMRELGNGYRTFVRHAKNLKLRNSRERLAAYIVQQSQLANGGLSMVLPMEKRHLASYLGMTPENLSRTVRSLQADGVSFKGTQVIITDPARLMAVALTDPLIDGPDPEHTGSVANSR